MAAIYRARHRNTIASMPMPKSRIDAGSGTGSADELRKLDAYWRASNYLSVGQIYLLDNPLH
jgi:phosphoketolase